MLKDADGWIISESIGKGVALTRFDYEEAYIYRIKGLKGISFIDILSAHSKYGAYPYDMEVNFRTALWFILKHYLGIVIPRVRDKKFNCQEHVCAIASELGFDLIPPKDYPACINLEHSPNLEFSWGFTRGAAADKLLLR